MVGWRKQTYSKNDCETSMNWLKKHTMVHTQKTTRGMIVTICNYSLYQDPDNYEIDREAYRNHTRNIQTSDTIQKKEKKEKKEIENPSTKKRVDFSPDSQFYKAAVYCVDRIAANHPALADKINKFQKYAQDIERITRLDKVPLAELREIIDFATSDPFWLQQFQSPLKLRKCNPDGIRYVFVWQNALNGSISEETLDLNY